MESGGAIASIHSFTGMQFPCLLLLYSIAGNFQVVKKFFMVNPRKFNNVKLLMYRCDYIWAMRKKLTLRKWF